MIRMRTESGAVLFVNPALVTTAGETGDGDVTTLNFVNGHSPSVRGAPEDVARRLDGARRPVARGDARPLGTIAADLDAGGPVTTGDSALDDALAERSFCAGYEAGRIRLREELIEQWKHLHGEKADAVAAEAFVAALMTHEDSDGDPKPEWVTFLRLVTPDGVPGEGVYGDERTAHELAADADHPLGVERVTAAVARRETAIAPNRDVEAQ